MARAKIHNAFPALFAWGIPLIITASCCYLGTLPDLRTAVPELVGVTAIVTALLALALYAVERDMVRWSPTMILVVAALLRLIFLFRPPELSDDIYRYLWDGLQTLAGHNPYTSAPANFHPTSANLASLLKQVNHPQLVTIYPPAAQFVFAAGAAAGGAALGLKSLLILLDLVTCATLMRVLPACGRRPSRALLYAWHPLPLLEIASSGHIDGAGVFFTIAAFALLISHHPSARFLVRTESLRKFGAGIIFAAATLTKMLPLVFLPAALRLVKGRKRIIFLLGVIGGGAAMVFPFLPELTNGLTTLGVYMRDWEFSGFLFRTLRRALSSGMSARLTLGVAFGLIIALVYGRLIYPLKDSQNTQSQVMTAIYCVVTAFLLLTPTLHPWYALYLVALLPFSAGPAGLILSWSILLSYRVLIPYSILGQWVEEDLFPALIWLAPVGAFLISSLVKALPFRQPRVS